MSQSNRKTKVDAEINENLRRAFAQVENEEVPDKIKQLLEQLRARSADNDDRSVEDE